MYRGKPGKREKPGNRNLWASAGSGKTVMAAAEPGKTDETTAGSGKTAWTAAEPGKTDETTAGSGIPLRAAALLAMLVLVLSCNRSYTPKPMGYARIDYPEKNYRLYNEQENFQFEVPDYSRVVPESSPGAEPGWFNVEIPRFHGKIHMSYKPVNKDLEEYIADSRTLAYKHTVRAEGIEESPFIHRDERRFGMVYDLKGEVASAVQFFITDSTDHFLRGSLYLNTHINRDSLNPVIDFLRADIIHLIETTRWKY